MESFYRVTLIANVLWFGAGLWFFWWNRETAARLLVPRSARSSPLFPTLREALPFLGGMNLALMLLSLGLLLSSGLFAAPAERALLLAAIAIAHATQFAVNVPIARRGGRIGETYWDVLRGTMLFIFVTDAAMAGLNGALALAFALGHVGAP